MYVVYKHTTPSGKVYIGITGLKPERRWRNGNGYKDNAHFYRAILKYGWENIKHEIVCAGLSKWQACGAEQSLIKYFDSTNQDKGYNHSIGGECSAAGVRRSAETRRKMSESLKGANNPWYGKHLSAETRKKLSESLKRTYLNHPELRLERKSFHPSVETRRKIGAANRGKHFSAEHRRKLSEANKGKNKGKHPSFETRRKLSEAGKRRHHSQETRKKMSESHKGKNAKAVICVETGIVYSSGREAAEATGGNSTAISQVLCGRAKTSGGYHWRYAD